jgi:hypothetical protein
MIQHQAYGVAASPRRGQQHERYLPVVELRAIRIPGVDRSFQAARALAAVAGMALVAIEDGNAHPLMVGQRFVSLQPVIDMMNPMPQTFGIHQGVHSSDTIGAAYGLTEPVVENLERAVSSSALRLPMRAQNRTATDLTTREVGMRGCSRRSAMPATMASENRKTFSEYAIRRRRMVSASLPGGASTPVRKLH